MSTGTSGSNRSAPHQDPPWKAASSKASDPRGDIQQTETNHSRPNSSSQESGRNPSSSVAFAGNKASKTNLTGKQANLSAPNNDAVQSDDGSAGAVYNVSSRIGSANTPEDTNNYPISVFSTANLINVEHPIERSIFGSCFLTLFFLIVSLVLFGPFLAILIPFLLLAVLIRWISVCCCCCQKPQLSHTSLRWLQTETPVLILLVLERGFDINRIRDLVYTRIVSVEGKDGGRLYPRFSQKVVPQNTGYVWSTDPNLRIDDHVIRAPSPITDICELLSSLSSSGLDMDRPLWDIHVVSEYPSATAHNPAGKEALLIVRIHPAMTDGISLVHLFCSALSDDQVRLQLKPRFAASAKLFNVLRSFIIGPVVFAQKWIFTRRDFNLLHPPAALMPPVEPSRRAFQFRSYCLHKVTRIKQVTRSTYNDLFLAVLAGALRSYQQARGVDHPFDLLTLVAVDMTRESSSSSSSTSSSRAEVSMKNNYVLVDLCLPTNTEGMIPRLWEVRQRMEELKNSADPVILDGLGRIMHNLFSCSLASKLSSSFCNKCTVTAVSLQGPNTCLSLGSKEIKAIAFWYPPVGAVNLSVSFFTYVDRLYYSVSADENLVPKLELITTAIAKQFDHMSLLLENRRSPGEHKGQSLAASGAESGDHRGSNIPGTAGGAGASGAISSHSRHEVKATVEELHLKLARVQLRLQEADQLKGPELDALRSQFSELMSEMRILKSSGLDGTNAAETADFDEEIEFDTDVRSRRTSLSGLVTLNARRRSLGSALARPLAVVGPRSRSGSKSAIHGITVGPRKQSGPSYPSDHNILRLSPEEAEAHFLEGHSSPTANQMIKDPHSLSTMEAGGCVRLSPRWWEDEV